MQQKRMIMGLVVMIAIWGQVYGVQKGIIYINVHGELKVRRQAKGFSFLVPFSKYPGAPKEDIMVPTVCSLRFGGRRLRYVPLLQAERAKDGDVYEQQDVPLHRYHKATVQLTWNDLQYSQQLAKEEQRFGGELTAPIVVRTHDEALHYILQRHLNRELRRYYPVWSCAKTCRAQFDQCLSLFKQSCYGSLELSSEGDSSEEESESTMSSSAGSISPVDSPKANQEQPQLPTLRMALVKGRIELFLVDVNLG